MYRHGAAFSLRNFANSQRLVVAAPGWTSRQVVFTSPVGIDKPWPYGLLLRTMSAYQMQGTPTQIMIDRAGHLRKQTFGMVEDLAVGAEIMSLLKEPADQPDEMDFLSDKEL